MKMNMDFSYPLGSKQNIWNIMWYNLMYIDIFSSGKKSCLSDYKYQSVSFDIVFVTNDEIQKISGSVGISDANYFVKIFKAEFGMTPGAYRKLYKI